MVRTMARTTAVLSCLATVAAVTGSCETDNGKKMGAPCTEDGDCQSDTCYEGRCAAWGLTCTPPETAAAPQCDDADDCTLDECAQVGKCFHRVDASDPECLPSEGGGTCRCGEAGVTIDAGTCTWEDATECTGWHSVCEANGKDSEAAFASGTTLCAFDCCLTLKCP